MAAGRRARVGSHLCGVIALGVMDRAGGWAGGEQVAGRVAREGLPGATGQGDRVETRAGQRRQQSAGLGREEPAFSP